MASNRLTPERDFQAEVMALARRCGWLAYHAHDSRRTVRTPDGRMVTVGDPDFKGWPDLTLIHEGRGLALFRELKVPPNKLTPEQEQCLRALLACGLDAAVWRPQDMPHIIATLTNRKVKT